MNLTTVQQNLNRKQISVDDGIVPCLQDPSYNYFCTVCQCPISSLINVYEHVKGNNHQARKTAREKNLTTVQQDLNRKQSPVNEIVCVFEDLPYKYFCIVCQCPVPTSKNVYEHLKGKKHRAQKEASITEKNITSVKQNEKQNSVDIETVKHIDQSSILDKVQPSEQTLEQLPSCTMVSLISTSNDMSSVKHNVDKTQEMQCVDNVQISVAADSISKQNVTLLQDKKATPGLFITPAINEEINKLLTWNLSKSTVKENRKAVNYNRAYLADYFLFEETMFSCLQMMLEKIKNNLQFYILSDFKRIKCLICNIEHSSRYVQIWYEHVSCRNHLEKLTLLSNEKSILLKQLMSNEMTKVVCYPCIERINQDEIAIKTHVNQTSHQKNYKLLTEAIERDFNSLLKETKDPLYYDIQYFACVPCKIRFKAKIEFMDHLYKKHIYLLDSKDNTRFGFCVTCAILWYESKERLYIKHCTEEMHRYLQNSKDFVTKPLSEKVTKFLENIDENVTFLLRMSSDRFVESNTHQIITDLQKTLNSCHLSEVKVHMYGSRYTGLALLNSDVDIFLDFGNECTTAELVKSRSQQIGECLRIDHKIWRIEEILDNVRTPIIRVKHISTGMDCDISYMNGLSVVNSKFIKSLNEAYLPCRKLILFVKKWVQLWYFESKKISNYALTWMVIFYLQVKHGMPSIISLIKNHKQSKIIAGWEVGVDYTFDINISELSIHKLALGFFEYYGEFDYMHSVICPLLGDKCDKKLFIFSEKPTFPEGMESYVRHLQDPNPEFFRIDSPMCVQDPFVLSFNVTRAVSVLTVRSFKRYCKESVLKLHKLHFANP